MRRFREAVLEFSAPDVEVREPMNNAEVSGLLEAGLGLKSPPIGVAFVTEAPANVAIAPNNLPAACALWRAAESGVLYAPLEAHANCPVGALVMGFELTAEITEDLQGVVRAMCEVEYLEEAEAERLPSISKPRSGVVYGPLGRLEQDPDMVLLWLTPAQAMLLSEAVGTTVWTQDGGARTLGRPGCAALPIAIGETDTPARTVFSLGCTGLRTYTGIDDGQMLCVLPLEDLGKIETELPRVLEANRQMKQIYLDRAEAAAARV